MTSALIVVESYFGNTRAIAEAVAAGLIEGGIEAQVVDVARAPSALPSDLDLLVLGAHPQPAPADHDHAGQGP